MLVFPNAKINIGLWLTEKRKDGYHNLESILLPIPLYDILEFVESKDVNFTNSGIIAENDNKQNIVYKVFDYFKQEYQIPNLKIHLHKIIPIGAGLGGGSSDAAFFIKELNNYFKLNISQEKLLQIAKQFGADVPFFIANKPSVVSGIGDKLKEIKLEMEGYYLNLIYPKIHISTELAYQNIETMKREEKLEDLIKLDLETWQKNISNDFEKFVFKQYPNLKKIKKNLKNEGAEFVSLTGSGSSLFSISKNQLRIKNSEQQIKNYKLKN